MIKNVSNIPFYLIETDKYGYIFSWDIIFQILSCYLHFKDIPVSLKITQIIMQRTCLNCANRNQLPSKSFNYMQQ